VPLTTAHAGSMWGFFFNKKPVRNFTDAKRSDAEFFRRFFHASLSRGVYLAPSPFEACFMSAAHGDSEVEVSLSAFRDAMGAANV
jgi:glutamate-1-semialdehyde 2,1-aminomutase